VRWSDWIGTLVHAHMQADTLVEDVLAAIVTWAAAIAVAYFGERLVFGKRRRKPPWLKT
jgi:small-conductance mechanosensitive channel